MDRSLFDANKDELNQLNKKIDKYKLIMSICFGLFIFFGIVHFPLFSVLIFFPLAYFSVQLYNCQKKYKLIYKDSIVKGVLDEVFTDLEYRPDVGFSKEEVNELGLCKLGNRYRSEDYISGKYNGHYFETSDVYVAYHTSNGKSSHTTVYFDGRMFKFKSDKPIKGYIQICPDKYYYGKRYQTVDQFVKMESVDFNKIFNIFATDEHEVFYYLTPNKMELFMRLYQEYGSVLITLDRDNIYIGLPKAKSNAFDASNSKKLDFDEERVKIRNDAGFIIEMMRDLELIEE